MSATSVSSSKSRPERLIPISSSGLIALAGRREGVERRRDDGAVDRRDDPEALGGAEELAGKRDAAVGLAHPARASRRPRCGPSRPRRPAGSTGRSATRRARRGCGSTARAGGPCGRARGRTGRAGARGAPPRRLAWCIARSAARKRSAAPPAWSGKTATPALAVSESALPSQSGREPPDDGDDRLGARRGLGGARVPGRRIAISSPPTRPADLAGHAATRGACPPSSAGTSSPARRPCVSFRVLKLSRPRTRARAGGRRGRRGRSRARARSGTARGSRSP